LVENLPDVKTESNEPVALPPMLIEKWKKEGRYEQEVAELDAFFAKTGYPRAPKYYIMKWLSDYITDYGIDGYRVDTVKHTYEDVWADFKKVCDAAFEDFKKNNPEKVLDSQDFFTVGEVYGYNIGAKKLFDFGDKKVNARVVSGSTSSISKQTQGKKIILATFISLTLIGISIGIYSYFKKK
jgi:alpha-amylase